MSKQIEITLNHYELSNSASIRAAHEAFGISRETLVFNSRTQRPIQVKATLEQFGAFVALRNAYGGVNCIKALRPTLVVQPARFDVTQYALL